MTEPVDEPPGPQVVVVGAATRDLDPSDPRGWRLGGGVTYSTLVLARLGLRVGAYLGVDEAAATALELDLLRDAGVDLVLGPLATGPVFELIETPEGRRLRSKAPSDPLEPDGLPEAWREASTWLLAPVDNELTDAWAALPATATTVGLGWQGLLRRRQPDGWVDRVLPFGSSLVRRADLVGVSRDDVGPATEFGALFGLLKPGSVLVLTSGDRGGLLATIGPDGQPASMRRYPAIPADQVEPTGAGDAFLAGFLAARLEPRLVGGRLSIDWQARLGAAIGSLLVEGRGLAGVPDRHAVRQRLARAPAV